VNNKSSSAQILIQFLNTVQKDFEFIMINKKRILNTTNEKIDSVWKEVKSTLEKTINQVEYMEMTQFYERISEVGLSTVQIEWEIEECEYLGEGFHMISDKWNSGTMVKNPPRETFTERLRPLLRWYNITLGTISLAFPLLAPVKEFDKVLAQKINP